MSIQEIMDNANGSAIDVILANQTKFEDELKALKSNASDYQKPTADELDRLSNLLESSLSLDEVRKLFLSS